MINKLLLGKRMAKHMGDTLLYVMLTTETSGYMELWKTKERRPVVLSFPTPLFHLNWATSARDLLNSLLDLAS
jgi:hypothetical protein